MRALLQFTLFDGRKVYINADQIVAFCAKEDEPESARIYLADGDNAGWDLQESADDVLKRIVDFFNGLRLE